MNYGIFALDIKSEIFVFLPLFCHFSRERPQFGYDP